MTICEQQESPDQPAWQVEIDKWELFPAQSYFGQQSYHYRFWARGNGRVMRQMGEEIAFQFRHAVYVAADLKHPEFPPGRRIALPILGIELCDCSPDFRPELPQAQGDDGWLFLQTFKVALCRKLRPLLGADLRIPMPWAPNRIVVHEELPEIEFEPVEF